MVCRYLFLVLIDYVCRVLFHTNNIYAVFPSASVHSFFAGAYCSGQALQQWVLQFYNYWDAALLFNLGLLSSFALYMFINGFSLALYVIEGFLVLLPLLLYIVGYIVRRLHSKYEGKSSKKSTFHGLFQLTRHLSLSGEDEPFIPNDDADLEI